MALGQGDDTTPRARLPSLAQARIGQALRDHFDDLVRQPVPPAMIELLARLQMTHPAPLPTAPDATAPGERSSIADDPPSEDGPDTDGRDGGDRP